MLLLLVLILKRRFLKRRRDSTPDSKNLTEARQGIPNYYIRDQSAMSTFKANTLKRQDSFSKSEPLYHILDSNYSTSQVQKSSTSEKYTEFWKKTFLLPKSEFGHDVKSTNSLWSNIQNNTLISELDFHPMIQTFSYGGKNQPWCIQLYQIMNIVFSHTCLGCIFTIVYQVEQLISTCWKTYFFKQFHTGKKAYCQPYVN